MVNYIGDFPACLKKYLGCFQKLFYKRMQVCLFVYVAGLMLELKRTSIFTIAEKNSHVNYQSLQYFLSESKWDPEKLNAQRIKELQSSRQTKSTKRGVFVIDDTACQKTGKNTEGAKPQYSHSEGRVINCNTAVVSGYADRKKHYPVSLRPYKPASDCMLGEKDPDFKSKIKLAKELFDDALENDIEFSDVVFDTWYFARELVEHIESKGCFWISEAEANRLISWKGQWVRADKLLKLIPAKKKNFKPVTVSNSRGEPKTFYTFAFQTKVKGLDGKKTVVVSKGSWDCKDPKRCHIYVTNHLSLTAKQVLERYSLRWRIEMTFRDLKEFCYFDHYQVRSLKAITRHWYLAFVAYTFLLNCKLKGCFSKVTKSKIETMGDCLEVYRAINSLSSLAWIKGNGSSYAKSLGLKSKRSISQLRKNGNF